LPGVGDLLAPFPGVSEVTFFVNAMDTQTLGMDLVLYYSMPLGPSATLGVIASANFTATEVTGVHVPETMAEKFAGGDLDTVAEVLVNRQAKNRLEELLPKQKGSLGLRYSRGVASLMTRANYYGKSIYAGNAPDGNEDEEFGAKVTFDLDIAYRLQNGLALSLGANNLLNTFPDEQQKEANRYFNQFRYRPDQFGMNGGFYYVRVQYTH
jgi:iron complex outermembrane receptor protein